MSIRTLKIAVAALAAALSLASQPVAAQGAAAKPIRLGALKGPSGIGLIRLFEAPPSLPGGAALEAIAVPSADVMTAKLVSGEYELATLPLNVAAKLRSAGIPVTLAAVIGDGMVKLLSADPAFASLADLKGKELYVAGQGATPDYLVRRLLKEAGLDPDKDLRLSYSLPYPEMAAALAAGKISYAVLPEPFATVATMANPGLKAPVDLGALWTKATGQVSYPMTALVATERFAAERPEALRAILAAAKDSLAWVKADPAAAGLLVEKHELGLKAPVAAKAIPRSAYVYVPAPTARPAVEALLKVFLETAPASVGGKLPDGAFYGAY
ncbi:MAG: ABC transporter substrate-binding protein [Spirochaetaceae bacterium]|nr:ABC transporter substrate-binding protein [Spirochaetaceae bacterium]